MAEKPTIPPPHAQADERAPVPAPTSVESDDAWAEVFVVSDGTGETAADTVRAAMLQFHARWRMRTFPDVRSATQARGVIEAASRNGALVVFTVVNREAAQVLKVSARTLERWTREGLVPYIRLPQRGRWSGVRFSRNQLLRWLRHRTVRER